MSDEELIARLHLPWPKDGNVDEVTLPTWVLALTAEAADRIEQLAATNEKLEKACKEWSEVSQSNYQRAKAAEAKLAEMLVVGDAMAASIEGNYYVSGIAKMWRAIAKIKGKQP